MGLGLKAGWADRLNEPNTEKMYNRWGGASQAWTSLQGAYQGNRARSSSWIAPSGSGTAVGRQWTPENGEATGAGGGGGGAEN